jgi:hypothetical protein
MSTRQTTTDRSSATSEVRTRRRGRGSSFPTPAASLPYLLFRTTAKDRWLLAMLAEHRVLTAQQITRLCYGTLRRANLRLLTLANLGLVERFRLHPHHYAPTPYHYVLGPQGAMLVAASHDLTVKEFRYDRAKLLRQAYRADLGHTLGCNDLLIELACRHRTDPTSRLEAWWDQDSCERTWGEHVRPDAYLEYTGVSSSSLTGESTTLNAWLEYDTGTEHLDQLVGKLAGYHAMEREYGTRRIVLFQLPDEEREMRLHARISGSVESRAVPVATSHVAEPANAVWRPVGDHRRLALPDLPAHFTARGTDLSGPCVGMRLVYAPPPTPDPAFFHAPVSRSRGRGRGRSN